MENRCIKLISYAEGMPSAANFEITFSPLRELADGEFLAHVEILGMDPFPRLRMSGDANVAPQIPLGSVMIGRGVGRVIESRHAEFSNGDYVAGELGWQEYAISNGEGVRKIDSSLAPISTSLGVLGPSGLAGYFSVLRLAQPKQNETIVISAASGSVGSVAGQIAKMQGARVVGIAGSQVQTNYLYELGFDAAVDFKNETPLTKNLGDACPNGIDAFVDLVGGEIHDAVMEHLNVGARIVLVGTLSNYNNAQGERDTGPRHLFTWILKRVHLHGFLVGDYAREFPNALQELALWIREGKLKYRETYFDGLENCPTAFAGLFTTDNVGKMLVRVSRE